MTYPRSECGAESVSPAYDHGDMPKSRKRPPRRPHANGRRDRYTRAPAPDAGPALSRHTEPLNCTDRVRPLLQTPHGKRLNQNGRISSGVAHHLADDGRTSPDGGQAAAQRPVRTFPTPPRWLAALGPHCACRRCAAGRAALSRQLWTEGLDPMHLDPEAQLVPPAGLADTWLGVGRAARKGGRVNLRSRSVHPELRQPLTIPSEGTLCPPTLIEPSPTGMPYSTRPAPRHGSSTWRSAEAKSSTTRRKKSAPSLGRTDLPLRLCAEPHRRRNHSAGPNAEGCG